MSSIFETYDRVVAVGGQGDRREWLAAARAGFEARTGGFRAEDAWFEARTRAFWDDMLTTKSHLRTLESELEERDRRWLPALESAHRGLFHLRGAGVGGAFELEDVLGGGAFVVHLVDDSLRPGLGTVEALFDGRVVADSATGELALLPGAFFHPAEATLAIHEIVRSTSPLREAALGRDRRADVPLDALLRMERTFRSLSRVKVSYAYRPFAKGAETR